MHPLVTILVSVLVFGFLIFIHEFGHYITARIFNVSITEFSIGMGPKLMWYDSKKTGIRYSIAMLPIGGFVAMVGEDEESDDPNAFNKKPAWQRFIITAAGATVNIVAGFLAMFIIVASINIGDTTVRGFLPDETVLKMGESVDVSTRSDGKLMVGDVIVAVEGNSVAIADELSYQIMRHGNEPVDITVIRDGERVELRDVTFPKMSDQGQEFGLMDFGVYAIKKDFGNFFSISIRKTVLVLRMCWESIADLITGRYTVAAVSGPVGISGAIGDAAVTGGTLSVLNIALIISINLGFMNLLPIPALDGGRLIVIIGEMITRKKVPAKIENAINATGLAVLLLLSFVILIKDVFTLF